MTVRSARVEDAEEVARLFGQFGHPQTADALRSALEGMLADPRAGMLVADDGAALLGALSYFLMPVVHEGGPWCRISALVIDEAHRGHGIGQMLVQAAETTARAAGCSRIEATSALHRTAAHRFYEKLDYGRTSAHFLKRL